VKPMVCGHPMTVVSTKNQGARVSNDARTRPPSLTDRYPDAILAAPQVASKKPGVAAPDFNPTQRRAPANFYTAALSRPSRWEMPAEPGRANSRPTLPAPSKKTPA